MAPDLIDILFAGDDRLERAALVERATIAGLPVDTLDTLFRLDDRAYSRDEIRAVLARP